MINNRKLSIDSTSSTSSEEWRNSEARDMFALLLGEYENSKRLCPHQRYKELKRIIAMFTADPVLDKLKWLSELQDEEEHPGNKTTHGQDGADPSSQGFVSDSALENDLEGEASTVAAFGNHMRRFVSKMKTLSQFPNFETATASSSSLSPLSSNTSSPPSTSSSDINDISSSSFCNNSSSNNNNNNNSNNNTNNNKGINRVSSFLHLTNITNFNNINNNNNNNNHLNSNNSNNRYNVGGMNMRMNINANNSAPTSPLSKTIPNFPGLPHIPSAPQFTRLLHHSDISESTTTPLCFSTSFDHKDCNTSSTTTPSSSSSSSSTTSSSGSLNDSDGYITFTPKDRSASSSCLSTMASAFSSCSTSASATTVVVNQRKSEFDKHVIKKNQIPAFEIPARRIPPPTKKDQIDPDTIVSSLYVVSNPSSPVIGKKLKRFRVSSSSPNISRFLGLDNDSQSSSSSSSSLSSSFCSHSHCHRSRGSSIATSVGLGQNKGLAAKFRHAVRRHTGNGSFSRIISSSQCCEQPETSSYCCSSGVFGDDDDSECCSCLDSNSNLNFDIHKGHSLLLEVKKEYEELPSWNVLSRYLKMKKMLKRCGALDVE